jgi:hypothetical protein
MMHRGLLDPEKDDPFSLFVTSTEIRYCYHAETEKVLGNTYGSFVPSSGGVGLGNTQYILSLRAIMD